MAIRNSDGHVHVLDGDSNVWSLITKMVDSGLETEAFFICDIGDIVRKHEMWQTFMPQIQPYYAVKCNDSEIVLRVLAALGVNFDCASKAEIKEVLSLGVSPDRISFANPTKLTSHIRYAAKMGVSTMTFDNEHELYKVKSLHPEAEMLIRISCDAKDALYPMSKKFGCDPVAEAPHLLRTAKQLNVDVVGVSFHVGSDIGDLSAFERAIAAAKSVFDVALTLGSPLKVLDIGGGFSGDPASSSLAKHAAVINSALQNHFSGSSVQIIAEPGRFYVHSAYTLACNIHSTRNVSSDVGITPWYYIDDGIFGSFSGTLTYNQRVFPKALRVSPTARRYPSTIWGPTCDPLDQIIKDVLLPELRMGDWIVFEMMGAYTLPLATRYHRLTPPKVHLVADESVWVQLKKYLPLKEKAMVVQNSLQIDRFKEKEEEEGKSQYLA